MADAARSGSPGPRDIVKRLRDARDFIGTRMNHPDAYRSELKAERPALMDTLRDAAEELDRHRRINLLRASEYPERMKEEDRLNELAERIEG